MDTVIELIATGRRRRSDGGAVSARRDGSARDPAYCAEVISVTARV